MPSVDPVTSTETDHDREKERERDRELDKLERTEKSGSKQKPAPAATKAKDLSHVPCKFFKVGACTAGSSCPFSHSVLEPGAQKEPCAWFVKGNCKFGHKCALAHILPGQSMSMDRKNKKAAQQAAAAAAAASGTGGEKSSKEGKKSKREGNSHSNNHTGRHNALLAGGSTAPTRLLTSTSAVSSANRPPMSLKAPISPSAPAPPLKDTDFASFAALDEMEGVQLPVPPAHGRLKEKEGTSSSTGARDEQNQPQPPSPVPLPTSAPRVTATMTPSEFGPIGSPPGMNRSQQRTPLNGGSYTPGTSPRGPNHLNGVKLGTSPPATQGFLSTSPFSAPGTQSVFLSSSYAGGGMAASLGTGLTMMSGRKGWGDSETSASPAKGGLSALASSGTHRSTLLNGNAHGDFSIELEYESVGPRRRQDGSAVEDGDMEDFIPGSLTELLTPEERSRRMSRSGSTKPTMSALSAGIPIGGGDRENTATRLGHRYSSSVPAPTLLGDIKSIWSDNTLNALPGSPSAQTAHRSTSSNSFATRFENLNINGQGDDMGMGMSFNSTGQPSSIGMISPSNASAAFLGLHHNYMKSKASQQAQLGMAGGVGTGVGAGTGVSSGLSRGLRGASNPLMQTSNNPLMNNYLTATGNQGLPSSATNPSTLSHLPSYRSAPSPFDLTQPMYQAHSQSARPIPAADNNRHAHEDLSGRQLLSPNSRALQAHALPPLTNLASPNAVGTGTFMPGTSPGPGTGMKSTMGNGLGSTTTPPSSADSIANSTNPPGLANNGPPGLGNTALYPGGSGVLGASPGLESVLGKLSYSAAAATARGGDNGGNGRTISNTPTPPGLSRTSSDRYQPTGMSSAANGPGSGPGSSLSPLRPRDDDDELFAMDK